MSTETTCTRGWKPSKWQRSSRARVEPAVRYRGIGGFSPRLDERGNSQRTRSAFARLSADMGLHLFAPSHGRLEVVGVQRESSREVFTLQGNVQSFTDVARRMTLEGLRRLRMDGRRIFINDPLQSLANPDLEDGTYPERS